MAPINVDVLQTKKTNQTCENRTPKIPAMVIHGYDVHEEDIDTMNPEELINDTILSVMLR